MISGAKTKKMWKFNRNLKTENGFRTSLCISCATIIRPSHLAQNLLGPVVKVLQLYHSMSRWHDFSCSQPLHFANRRVFCRWRQRRRVDITKSCIWRQHAQRFRFVERRKGPTGPYVSFSGCDSALSLFTNVASLPASISTSPGPPGCYLRNPVTL